MAFDKKTYNKGTWSKKMTPKPKKIRNREALAAEEQKKTMQIADLSYDFAKRIVYLHQYLIEESNDKEYKMADQVYRSGTSIGANVRESNHAQSAADFLSKMQIALKEADETPYWLNLLHAGDYITDVQNESLNHDNERILKVLTSIVGTTAKKIKESKKRNSDNP